MKVRNVALAMRGAGQPRASLAQPRGPTASSRPHRKRRWRRLGGPPAVGTARRPIPGDQASRPGTGAMRTHSNLSQRRSGSRRRSATWPAESSRPGRIRRRFQLSARPAPASHECHATETVPGAQIFLKSGSKHDLHHEIGRQRLRRDSRMRGAAKTGCGRPSHTSTYVAGRPRNVPAGTLRSAIRAEIECGIAPFRTIRTRRMATGPAHAQPSEAATEMMQTDPDRAFAQRRSGSPCRAGCATPAAVAIHRMPGSADEDGLR